VEEMPGAQDDREDGDQIHVLSLDGGEAQRLTDLPRGVVGFSWSPDGKRLAVLSSSRGATRDEDRRKRGKGRKADPADPPRSDYRFADRLSYQYNGAGYIVGKETELWVVDAGDGSARRLTTAGTAIHDPAWSPDGARIAFSTDRRPDRDQMWHQQVYVIDAESGQETRVTDAGHSSFRIPSWLPDNRTLAVLGHRFPARAGSRNDIWLFAADGSEADRAGGRNLSGRHDLMVAASMSSDLTPGEEPRVAVTAGGRWITFSAPYGGSYELWRISTESGDVIRLTEDRHYISAFDQVTMPKARKPGGGAGADSGTRIAYARSSPTNPPDIWTLDVPAAGSGKDLATPRRLTDINADALAEIDLVSPVERWVEVDGRAVQGWYIAPAGDAPRPAPLVTEIHGGPHTLYGWSPCVEFQVLAGAGIGVFYSNPRGSEGYGQDFNSANFRDWGPGPTRDVLAGVESLVADGLADPARLGVTGGSYGGYLTNWIVGHDQRFRAAVTCRSVVDLTSQFLSGDLGGAEFGREEFGAAAWEDPTFYREHSPLTYAPSIKTPLLIQHSEQDLRCTITQAEELFSVLRIHGRRVRLMRVPGESHELTRSGTPFRRAENLVQVRDWFRHFLIDGKRGLPRLPRERAGR
ncbi:MAG: S9 family peptidase, partial [Chloroflexota bacterium]|nr:S9 family peptidase [Chloroflexota bacterium]